MSTEVLEAPQTQSSQQQAPVQQQAPATGPASLPPNADVDRTNHYKQMVARVKEKALAAEQQSEGEQTSVATDAPPEGAQTTELKPTGEKYAWGELKKENKTLREEREAFTKKEQEANARIQELEKKLEEGSITGKQLSELQQKLEAKEKREEELQRDLAYWDITKLPAWETDIVTPYNENYAALQTVSKAYGIDMASLEKAMYEPDLAKQDRMMEDLLAEIPSNSKRRIENAISNIQSIDARAQSMRKNAVETFHAAQERQKQEREAQSAKEKEVWSKAFDAVKGEMTKRHSGLLSDENISREVFEEASKVDFNTMPPDAKAMAVQAMYLTPRLENHYQTQITKKDAEIKELKDALERYAKKPGPGSPTANGPETSKIDHNKAESMDDREARYRTWKNLVPR